MLYIVMWTVQYCIYQPLAVSHETDHKTIIAYGPRDIQRTTGRECMKSSQCNKQGCNVRHDSANATAPHLAAQGSPRINASTYIDQQPSLFLKRGVFHTQIHSYLCAAVMRSPMFDATSWSSTPQRLCRN